MPDWLLKKLAEKGGLIGFQIGNDFHNPKAFAYRTAHTGKPFWSASENAAREADMTIDQVDALAAPQFPMLPFDLPASIRMSVADWVGVVDRAIQLVGEDHVALGSDFDGGPPPPIGIRDVSTLPLITEAMVRRGYSEARIDKFLGGNVLRVFREVTQGHQP
jgi:membrane dipeptidase